MKLSSSTLKAILSLALGLSCVPRIVAAEYYVAITEFGPFDPSYLEVHVGDTVWWGNEDYFSYYRTTICSSYPWNSGHIPYGYEVGLTVNKIGTFSYYDSTYYVWGTLVVK